MTNIDSHPALENFVLLVRDHGLGKWFPVAPSSIKLTGDRPSGLSFTLEFITTSGTTTVFIKIKTDADGNRKIRQLGRPGWPNVVSDRSLAFIPQTHPNFFSGFDSLDDIPGQEG